MVEGGRRKSASRWVAGCALIASALLLATLGACSRGRRDGPTEGDGVVGRYQGGVVTAIDLQREANRLPPTLREQFDRQNGRREMVGALIDKRLLAQEARKRGFGDNPELRRQVAELEERLAIQALLGAEERAAGAASDAEARAWFEGHKQELAQPERVRISRVLAAISPQASEAERKKARGRAEGFAQRLRRGEAFGKVAAQGDGPERSRGGDLGLLSRGGGKDRKLEDAAFALVKPGDLSPVLAYDEGFAVLRLVERRTARVPSFEEARAEVANRLEPERKRKAFDGLIAKLRKEADVQIEIAAAPH